MLKFVLLCLALSGLQAVPLPRTRDVVRARSLALGRPSTHHLPNGFHQGTEPMHGRTFNGFRQGTEPSSRYLIDLDTGLMKEHKSEMDRRVLPVAIRRRLGHGFGEMQRRHWLLNEVEVPAQRKGEGWVRVKEPSTYHLPEGFSQGTEPIHAVPDVLRRETEPNMIPEGFRQGTEPIHIIRDGFRQGTEPNMIPDGFRQGTEPIHTIRDGFRQGTEPNMIPEGFRQGTEPMTPEGFTQETEPIHIIPDGFRQGTEPNMIPDGFRQGTEPMVSIPEGFRQGTEPMVSIPEGFRQGTEPMVSIPEGFRQGTEPMVVSIPEGFRQRTEPISIPEGFRQGTEPMVSIPEGFRQGTESSTFQLPEGYRQGTEFSTSTFRTLAEKCDGEIINERCYHFNPIPLAFREAQSSCRALSPNADLASVTNHDLHSRLASMVTKSGTASPVQTWLGGVFQNQQAEWTDGSEWGYSDWMPGHPNIRTDKPVCLEMFRLEESWWSAVNCELKRASICSYPMAA